MRCSRCNPIYSLCSRSLKTFFAQHLNIGFIYNFMPIDRMQEMEIKISNNNSVNKNTDIRDYSIINIVALNSAYI